MAVSQGETQALADLEVLDADGQARKLGSLWAERPAALVFVRHFG